MSWLKREPTGIKTTDKSVRPDVPEHPSVGVEGRLEMRPVAGFATQRVSADFLSDLLSVSQRGVHATPFVGLRAASEQRPAGPAARQ